MSNEPNRDEKPEESAIIVENQYFDSDEIDDFDSILKKVKKNRSLLTDEDILDEDEQMQDTEPNLAEVNTENMNILQQNRSFGYLDDLHFDPTMEFVHHNASKLNEHVKKPIKSLLSEVASILPLSITSRLETENEIFSKKPFHQNKWGFGNNANDFYWGAFYPKGSSRSTHGQLFLWINYQRLEFGFSIGEYGTQQKKRFAKNLKENQSVLSRMLRAEDCDIKVYTKCNTDCVGPVSDNNNCFNSWESWLKDPNETDIYTAKGT